MLIQEADPREVCLLGKMAFITFRGLSLHRGKNLLNVQAKWWVYETAWQMYSPNVECKTRKWHESFLVIFCIILTWIYSKLTKIQKTTEKGPDCEIHGLWLKDVFRKDQYKLHFTRSLLSNIQHNFFCGVKLFILRACLLLFLFRERVPLKVMKASKVRYFKTYENLSHRGFCRLVQYKISG